MITATSMNIKTVMSQNANNYSVDCFGMYWASIWSLQKVIEIFDDISKANSQISSFLLNQTPYKLQLLHKTISNFMSITYF